jgi:cytochrome c oxidase subunit IV
MVWFEIIPSLVLTAGPLLFVAAPVIYIGNWYFLNGKVRSTFIIYYLMIKFLLEIRTEKYDKR